MSDLITAFGKWCILIGWVALTTAGVATIWKVMKLIWNAIV
jgi:hypothetical protein